MVQEKCEIRDTVDSVVQTAFDVLPLIRKKLLRMDDVQSDHTLPLSHIQVLSMLSGGAMSATEISRRLGIAKPNITPMIDRLIEDGYVVRERSKLDRRVVNIALLSSGEDKLHEIFKSIAGRENDWIGHRMKDRDLTALERSLQTIEKILRQYT